MNFDQIIDIIENNSKVTEQVLSDVEKYQEKFPFTSLFPMIILKGLKDSKNIHFEAKLKAFAIQINDRNVLERYLDSESVLSKEIQKPAPVAIVSPKEEVQIETPIEEKVVSPEIPKEIKIESVPTVEVSIVETQKEPEIKPEVVSEKPEEIKVEKLDPETLKIIKELQDKEIELKQETTIEPEIEEILNQDVSDKTTEPKIVEDKIEDEVEEVLEVIQEEAEEEVYSFKKKKKEKRKEKKKKKEKEKEKQKDKQSEKKKEMELVSDQNVDSPFKFKKFEGEDAEFYHLEVDFSDLEPLLVDESDKTIPVLSLEKETKVELSEPEFRAKTIAISKSNSGKKKQQTSSFKEPVKIVVTDKTELTFLDWLKLNKKQAETKTTAIKTSDSSTNEALVDRFIEESPSISPTKQEFFSPVKNAKKSLEDDLEIISPTLAELHVFQHNYSKAKKIYKKLILKFPEKKSLFAEKLEEITQLQKKN